MHVGVDLAIAALLLVACYVQVSESLKCKSRCETRYIEKYSEKCGWPFKSWKRCTKYRYRTRHKDCYHCCPNYHGGNCEIPRCISGIGKCPNGGTCISPNKCIKCQAGFYSPHCYRCTHISNCEETRCTTSVDQHCIRCGYERGIRNGIPVRAFTTENENGKPSRVCMKRCSWRSDSQFCYPGRCPPVSTSGCPNCVGTPASCQCAPGFGPTNGNCLTISAKPHITHCLATLIQKNHDYRVDRKCDDVSATKTVYTNLEIDIVQVNWVGKYHGPTATDWPKPYFVNDFKVGVVDGGISCSLLRGTQETALSSKKCKTVNHQGNPNMAIMDCKETMDITVQWKHGDRIQIKSFLKNGGYVKLNNFDYLSVAKVDSAKYYSGSTITHMTYFTFDLVSPSHCSVTSSCNKHILDVGKQFTRNGFEIRWGGWADADSGITSYHYEVYPLAVYGNVLSYRTQKKIHSGTRNSPTNFTSFTPTSAGVYAVLLTVSDVAGNHRMARRFVMYDNQTRVEIVQNKLLWVSSSNSKTDYLWLNNLSPNVNGLDTSKTNTT